MVSWLATPFWRWLASDCISSFFWTNFYLNSSILDHWDHNIYFSCWLLATWMFSIWINQILALVRYIAYDYFHLTLLIIAFFLWFKLPHRRFCSIFFMRNSYCVSSNWLVIIIIIDINIGFSIDYYNLLVELFVLEIAKSPEFSKILAEISLGVPKSILKSFLLINTYSIWQVCARSSKILLVETDSLI